MSYADLSVDDQTTIAYLSIEPTREGLFARAIIALKNQDVPNV